LEILVAKTAGYCFGVSRAVNKVFELLNDGVDNIYTLGPVIHNEQVIKKLKQSGVKVAEKIHDIEENGHVIIRAHGVGPEVYKELEEKGIRFSDATCPYVKRIHKLIMEEKDRCDVLVIVGDKNHPEVIGINGWCDNSAYIIDDPSQVDDMPSHFENVCVFAQTTITSEKWEKIIQKLKNKFKNVKRFDTICSATAKRQEEAAEIASNVDMMVVIGSTNSSNTRKLYEICKACCPLTYQVETSYELPEVDVKKIKKIGITAGASTPDWIIKEVIEKMSEYKAYDEQQGGKEMQSFEELLDKSFENSCDSLSTGDIVKGRIQSYKGSEILVDLGCKYDGVIPLSEFTDDPDFNIQTDLNIGEEIEVFVVRVNDAEGKVTLSKKRVDSIKGWDLLEEAFNSKQPVKIKISEIVNGGAVGRYRGIRVFVPASQISDKYVSDLNEFLNKVINVRIIDINKQKKKVVGSHKVILKEEKEKVENEFWSNIEVGKKYRGVVKSLSDFGAFIDLGGVDGLLHVSELAWGRVKHPSELIKVGDVIEVSVIDFDKDKKKISLTYKKPEDNPWNITEAKYKTGDVVKAKVVRMTPFGAFVELDTGVDGLVHISQISNVRIPRPEAVLSIGQEVEAKIIEMNAEAKKISLSIKEVSPIDPQPKSEEKTQ